jgi:beta-lactamase regulating signal transducer with metallopeptidase domain
MIIWIGVISLFAILLVLSIFYLRRNLRHCPKIERDDLYELLEKLCSELNIHRPIELFYLDNKLSISPVLVGILHPKIYIPRLIADEWTVEDIKPILLHELVHIKRFDPAMNWVQFIIQAIYFFHPLVWIANRKIRHYREDSCDDIAIQIMGNKKKTYSQCIVNVLQETSKEPFPGFLGIAFSERKNSLARRVIRILDIKYQPNNAMKIQSLAALLLIAIISFIISCDNLVGVKKENISTIGISKQINAENPSVTNIHITADGKIFISNIEISKSNLSNSINEILKKKNNKMVTIITDNNTKQQNLLKLIEAAGIAGAGPINVISR